MKKAIIIFGVFAIMALSSCQGNKRCPAYDQIKVLKKATTLSTVLLNKALD
jgi:hypothetical protein